MTSTAASRTRRLEPDQRRQQILECAVRLFGERPYSAVSTTELANEAGVTRGLLHHYFGTKRGLYVEVVRRMVLVPEYRVPDRLEGTVEERIERSVDWLLDAVSVNAKTWLRIVGTEGVGDDPEIEGILALADDVAARQVLARVGIDADGDRAPVERAMVRAYGGMVKHAIREWVRDGELTRDQVRLLLVKSLLAIVTDVLEAPG